jgi:hypothetical protein
LHQQPWVRSVAQIGNQLRVLIRKDFTDAAAAVRGVIESDGGHVSECAPDSASLEDVFVAATLKQQRQDAAA